MNKSHLRALTLTVACFGFIGFEYIAMNATFHPETLPLPLTHLLPFPREDTFGIMCFAASFLSFLWWRLLEEERRS